MNFSATNQTQILQIEQQTSTNDYEVWQPRTMEDLKVFTLLTVHRLTSLRGGKELVMETTSSGQWVE